MTYRIDRSLFVENGPTIAADAAIARVRKTALYAALEQQKAEREHAGLKKAA